MNRTKTQWNATKKSFLKSMITNKFYTLCWFIAGIMLSLPSNAQTNNCPSGDPLEWDWIQAIIVRSNGCSTNEIRQFNYEGSTYYYVAYDRTGFFCSPGISNDHSDIYYDCNGNFICAVGFAPICESPIIAGRDNYTTIWNYNNHFPKKFEVTACPEQTKHFFVGFKGPDGAICDPADQQIGIDPILNEPVISNFAMVDNCTVSFSVTGEGTFTYTAGISNTTLEVGEWIFEIKFSDECNPTTPAMGYTICPSEPIIIGDQLAIPPVTTQPPAGQLNCNSLIRSIEPNNGTVQQDGDSFILSPDTSIVYTISSYYGPAISGDDCVEGITIEQKVNLIVLDYCKTDIAIDYYFPYSGEYTIEGCVGDVVTIQSDFYHKHGIIIGPPFTLGNSNIIEQIAPDIFELTINKKGQIGFFGTIGPYLKDKGEMRFNVVIKDDCETNTATCPENDPLQLNWIQDLIASSDGDNIAAIHQFEFEGNTHFQTVNADLENESYVLYFNCEGELLCEMNVINDITTPCDDLDMFLASFFDFTIIWSYEDPFQAVTCPPGEPLQWNWVQDLTSAANVCVNGMISQFDYNGNTYFQISDGPSCNSTGYRVYYNCLGETICYYDNAFGGTCDRNFLSASSNANNLWTYDPSVNDICMEGDPLQWDWMQRILENYNACYVAEIQQFEYNGLTYFQMLAGEPESIPCFTDEVSRVYDCEGKLICVNGGDNPFVAPCEQEIISANNNNNTIWAYEPGPETCPEGDPLQWGWVQNLIQSDTYCTIGELRQFEYEGDTYIYNTPRTMDDGLPCAADYYPQKYYTCNGEFVCELGLPPPDRSGRCGSEIFSADSDYSTIWVYQDEPVSMNQMKCPDNNTTSICAPVSIPPSMAIQDFSTTNDANYLNSMTMQMEEQTEMNKYFNTTSRIYIISDEAGNQKTCETKHHIANQFLQMPEVSEPGIICEEDLWSYVKIGTDQYKIYNDHNGSKGEMMSTCNTPSLICSTADLGVDTKVSGEYHFWASTYFEFPDGSICESEAMPFYVDVQAKPVAELSASNKTMQVGEGMQLMDMVTSNKSGYWSGENIVYLMTVTGENNAYFSANSSGVYKLYYTVKNDFCERSYLLIVEVERTSYKPNINNLAYKQVSKSFSMYPNPATDKVFIDLYDQSNYQIYLIDISGKKIKQMKQELNATSIEMNLIDLPRGMCLVELKNGLNSTFQKLVIE